MTEELKAELKEEARAMGLDLAEETVEKAVEFLFAALPKIAASTSNQVDDAIVQFLPLAKPIIMELIDKIDGKTEA